MSDVNQLADAKVVELLKALGKAYLENGEYQKAIEKFKKLYSSELTDLEITQGYALALVETSAVEEEAISIYEKAVNESPDDENLFLKLADLFLKNDITQPPAVKIFHKSLTFSSPLENDIRAALSNIFKNNISDMSIEDVKNILLQGDDNTELLLLFLKTVWSEQRFDEGLNVLKALYFNSAKNPLYSNAICNTLLEKKSCAEENNKAFTLTTQDAYFCLKHFDPNQKISKIEQFEAYLDFKNLLITLQKDGDYVGGELSKLDQEFLDDGTFEDFSLPDDFDSTFSFAKDVIGAFAAEGKARAMNGTHKAVASDKWVSQSPVNTAGLIEIKNYGSDPKASKLPFKTFLGIISEELNQSKEVECVTTEDGLILLATNPQKMISDAVEIIEKVERYNIVVNESEKIVLHITIHSTPLAFSELEYNGIREIRKTCKIHNFQRNTGESNSRLNSSTLIVSEQVTSLLNGMPLHKLGGFRFKHFPQKHFVFRLDFDETKTKTVQEPKKEASTKRHLGKYEVAETLKESSIYSTYRGYDPQLERSVIIKAFRAEAFAPFKNIASLRKQFYEEIRKLNRINHPNIGVIYDAGEEGDTFFLVREFIDSKTLRQYIASLDQSDLTVMLEIFGNVCRVLENYHKSQIWHKNLKPENIFVLGDHQEIKVVDGGLLQIRGDFDESPNHIELIAYSTPEQLEGRIISQSCDNFQLATIIYECLANVHPFRTNTFEDTKHRILNHLPDRLSSASPQMPIELDGIIAKSLNKNADERYSSITEFEQDLRSLLEENEVSTRRRMYELLK